MAHLHSIYDTDLHFIVDPITRKISSESGKVTLMQRDHNSERFTFEIPRYIEGHDMSLTDILEIHYINIDSANKKNKNQDIYVVDDLQISPDSEDMVIASWLISQNATQFSGSLHFILRFVCHNGEEIEYQWFSDIYTAIKIGEGIYNAEIVDISDLDLLECWRRDIIRAVGESDVYESMFNCRDEALNLLKETDELVSELNEKISENKFTVNFDTGCLECISPNYNFTLNTKTGNLEWEVKE